MKPEQQRIAIAKACGWKREYSEAKGETRWYDTDGMSWLETPDYLNDLNAMHEAEKVLDEDQYDDFVCFLCPENDRKHYKSWGLEGIAGVAPRFLVSPTAAQRAEAFLRTLNLWTS